MDDNKQAAETPQPKDENGNPILAPGDAAITGTPTDQPDSAKADGLSPVVPSADPNGVGSAVGSSIGSQLGTSADTATPNNNLAAATPEAKPVAHEDGGATLSPGATLQPVLVASVEVYKGEDGTFRTNLTADGLTHPQHTCDDADEVRGVVDEFLTEKLAA